jgi:hypothetical protein
MKSIYISSTREDLKKHLRRVTETLQRCGYNVEAMEKYHARDNRPKDASVADAAKCDIYVGIFAWRYDNRGWFVDGETDFRFVTDGTYCYGLAL